MIAARTHARTQQDRHTNNLFFLLTRARVRKTACSRERKVVTPNFRLVCLRDCDRNRRARLCTERSMLAISPYCWHLSHIMLGTHCICLPRAQVFSDFLKDRQYDLFTLSLYEEEIATMQLTRTMAPFSFRFCAGQSKEYHVTHMQNLLCTDQQRKLAVAN